MKDKPWAVVQDLFPFGIRIDSQHRTKAEAERRMYAIWIPGISVMRTEEARDLDRKMVEDAGRRYGFSADEADG